MQRHSHCLIYKNLTNLSICCSLSLSQSQPGAAADAFTKAFLRNCLPQMKDEDIEASLCARQWYSNIKDQRRRREDKKGQGTEAKERRQLKIFQLKPEHQKYTLFHPVVLYKWAKALFITKITHASLVMIVDMNSSCLCVSYGNSNMWICVMD